MQQIIFFSEKNKKYQKCPALMAEDQSAENSLEKNQHKNESQKNDDKS